jgi:citrate lyase alpha subunit
MALSSVTVRPRLAKVGGAVAEVVSGGRRLDILITDAGPGRPTAR